MNTGVHDAVNLSWKLGGVLHGWYKKEILQTYGEERRVVAQELIRQDKELATLLSGNIPDALKNSELNANELLANTVSTNAKFLLGLGVHYDESEVNVSPSATSRKAGWRPPDVLLRGPGSHVSVRLQTLTPNSGAFWVIVFAGEPLLTQTRLAALRSHFDSTQSFTHKGNRDAVRFLTVIAGAKSQGEAALGVKRFGKVYYDPDSSAHNRYGIAESSGGIVVLRPDGILGFAAPLTRGDDITTYFSGFT